MELDKIRNLLYRYRPMHALFQGTIFIIFVEAYLFMQMSTKASEALYKAAEENNLTELNRFVKAGADIEYRSHKELIDRQGRRHSKFNTSLHAASLLGFVSIVLRLLELKANVNTINKVSSSMSICLRLL